MSRVVAVVSHAGAADALSDLATEHSLAVVGPVRADGAPSRVTHELRVGERSRLSQAVVRIAWRSAVGRNLIRNTPLDQSRRLWRAARADRAVRALVRDADIVLAVDRDAVFTVWKMTRSRQYGDRWAAVFGASAARYVAANHVG